MLFKYLHTNTKIKDNGKQEANTHSCTGEQHKINEFAHHRTSLEKNEIIQLCFGSFALTGGFAEFIKCGCEKISATSSLYLTLVQAICVG